MLELIEAARKEVLAERQDHVPGSIAWKRMERANMALMAMTVKLQAEPKPVGGVVAWAIIDQDGNVWTVRRFEPTKMSVAEDHTIVPLCRAADPEPGAEAPRSAAQVVHEQHLADDAAMLACLRGTAARARLMPSHKEMP